MSRRSGIVCRLTTRMVSCNDTASDSTLSFLVPAMGVGRSKKEAKHAAAKALIDKLTGLNLSDTFYQQQKSFNTNGSPGALNTSSSSTNFDEKNQMGNPIGVLQEFCMSKHWPPPQYEVEVEVGLPHERQFTIGCLVLKYREVGMGKSKKIAKRQAAQKMWERLQSQPLDQTDIVQSCIDDANDEVSVTSGWLWNMMGLVGRFGESFNTWVVRVPFLMAFPWDDPSCCWWRESKRKREREKGSPKI